MTGDKFHAYSAGSQPKTQSHPYPVAVEGRDEDKRLAFLAAYLSMKRRIELLAALPLDKLDRTTLLSGFKRIGQQ